ncbi:macrophage mannose receptor 1-like [Thalassophryne amazonica]|uniref:macrophage mannose receptor 1-like n=1 Tax=Thalassophryne amazonica TaxID=390379 RepID=UPI001471E5C6|nr:macrophage mannose receptor 1-like [Thalassophryne amazonica]
MSDIVHENEFAWANGNPVLYTNWAEKEPNNAGDGEHCVVMTHNHLVTGRWNDDACHMNRSFVCYKIKSSSITPPPTQNPCQEGYTPWYQNCYKLVEEPATWEEAQKACMKERANLASIDTSYEQAYVSLMVLKGNADVWIGLSRKDNTTYTWSDGWPVLFTEWGPGEPSNEVDEGCVTMRGHLLAHGTWNDTECNQLKNYICKTTTETPPPTPAPGNGKCLKSFVPYGQYCYHVYNGMVGYSWPNSRHKCSVLDAELASVHSRAEVEFIRNLDKTKDHNLWIGLTRDNYFAWGWTDETSVGFVNWAAGEPSLSYHPGEAPEKCVEMYHDGKWNDNDCLQERGFVCRRRQDHTTDETPITVPTVHPPVISKYEVSKSVGLV